MPKLDLYTPAQVFSSEPPDLSSPKWRFLAEGDSWFSLGTLDLVKNSSLLLEMVFSQSACAINCATPGDTLKRMSQVNTDPNFIDLLCGKRARHWDAILMSCGGNDLIEAVQSPAFDSGGQPVPQALRLLRTVGEWGPAGDGAARYLSDPGWTTFSNYLQANFEHLVGLRDGPRGASAGQPIFVHGYAYPTPRPAGAGLGIGPWLYPALKAYAVPDEDYIALAHELLSRLAALFEAMVADTARFPNLHFFDSAAVDVEPATLETEGVSGDWVNEIHLTRAGYRKIAVPWAAAIEAVLPS
jgi:lysophospholipase L1-like esterase